MRLIPTKKTGEKALKGAAIAGIAVLGAGIGAALVGGLAIGALSLGAMRKKKEDAEEPEGHEAPQTGASEVDAVYKPAEDEGSETGTGR